MRCFPKFILHFSPPAIVLVMGIPMVGFVGCDQQPPPPKAEAAGITRSASQKGNLKERQLAFLNRIREADPQGRTIDRALLNEQNNLGLILDRSVEMEKIPALMRTMLTRMAREFPGEDLTILAYAPSKPPRKVGTAHLNARTREMNYTPEP
jgi:hypothetical protein